MRTSQLNTISSPHPLIHFYQIILSEELYYKRIYFMIHFNGSDRLFVEAISNATKIQAYFKLLFTVITYRLIYLIFVVPIQHHCGFLSYF